MYGAVTDANVADEVSECKFEQRVCYCEGGGCDTYFAALLSSSRYGFLCLFSMCRKQVAIEHARDQCVTSGVEYGALTLRCCFLAVRVSFRHHHTTKTVHLFCMCRIRAESACGGDWCDTESVEYGELTLRRYLHSMRGWFFVCLQCDGDGLRVRVRATGEPLRGCRMRHLLCGVIFVLYL